MHRILVPKVRPPQGDCSSLGDHLASWLETLPWDFYWTITTRRPRTDSLGLIRDITAELHNQGCSRAFIGCEPFKVSHNLHAHGLLLGSSIGGLPRKSGYLPGRPSDVWAELFHRFGRSRVEFINNPKQVASYCSKYVTKLSDGDNWALWMLDSPEEVPYCEASRPVLPYVPPNQAMLDQLSQSKMALDK